ncbi:MAG: hypothetical protein K2J93_03525 [Anaeroplasmataceae bacterium]|nr:hypothetical protein [Anaeroplasmataceae bacterium]
MKKKILFLVFVLVSLFGLTIPSQAATNSLVINDRDTRIFGLLPKNQNDSLLWKQLELKCNVYDTSRDNHFYKTSNEAKATYKIENEKQNIVKEEFILPYFEIENSVDYKLQETSIVVDGEQITPKLRHACTVSGTEFYYNKEIPLYDGYKTNEKFNTNTSVHKITAKADVSNLKDSGYYLFNINVKQTSETTVVIKNLNSMDRDSFENYTFTFKANKWNSSFELYFIGELPEFTIEHSEYLSIEESDGNLLSFANFNLPENISLVDWFNIIVERLNNLNENHFNRNLISYEELTSTLNVMSFLMFSIEFEPYHTVTIETSTPFYVLGSDNSYQLSGYLYKGILRTYVKTGGGYDITNFIGGKKDTKGYYLLEGFEFEIIFDSTVINRVYDIGLMVVGGILTFFLYIIPMIIMIILFARRRDKKSFVLLYIQKFLSYSLFFFGFLFLIISDSDLAAGIVMLCLFGILTITTLIQNIKNNCKDFARLILETLCWVLIIYNLSFGDVFVIFASLLIFCFIEFIFVTIRIRKLKAVNPDLPKNCLRVGIL